MNLDFCKMGGCGRYEEDFSLSEKAREGGKCRSLLQNTGGLAIMRMDQTDCSYFKLIYRRPARSRSCDLSVTV